MSQSTTNDAEMIGLYVESMKWKRLADTTIYVRETYLNKLFNELGPFADIKADALRTWLGDPERDLSASSQAMLLTTFHGFFAFCRKKKFFKNDPTKKVDKPKTAKGTPHPIPDDELARAFASADRLMTCWLSLGAYAGLRCCELATLEREHIHDDETMRLFVAHAKGGKTRWIPLNPKILDALNAWEMPATGRLWDLTPQDMSKAINTYLHNKIGTKSTAHALRHFFATKLYQQTKDIRLVQILLGHSSTATTQIYADCDISTAAPAVSLISFEVPAVIAA